MILLLYLVSFLLVNAGCEYFDSYKGIILTEEQVRKYQEIGNIEQCTNNIKLPCDPDDWRRLDGSCNNLQYPSYGTVHTPAKRLLEPIYGTNLIDRRSESGGELPLVRKLRTDLLREGKSPDSTFTQLMTYFMLYSFTDNGSIQDTMNYVLYTLYCCEEFGKGRYECTPHRIPDDDPVHRFSHVRCMNQTRSISFQTYGCLQNGTTVPARHNTETFVFDLSSVYFFQGKPAGRTYAGGELVVEEIKAQIWPERDTSTNNICVLNDPKEDLCFKSTSNGVLGGKFMTVYLVRQHNNIARQLAARNPCWDDERLFYTARDINIALVMQIYTYELMGDLLGKENLINEGILSKCSGFRDIYDGNILPQLTEEFVYCLRYFHTVQETKIKLYDNQGYYSQTFPITNLTLNTGYLLNHFNQITQSSFRQPCAKFDHTVDPGMSEVGLGPLQYSSDITMNDLAKGRQIGFQGYVKYREYCSGKRYKTFEDLSDVMNQDRIQILRDSYEALGDVDLMAGIWSEKLIPGGHVPYTVYCLFVDQLRRFIKTDRHWYERKDRPHAFTAEQLQEIRKSSMASLLCVLADNVNQIQRHAFLKIGPKNPLLNCSDIPRIDFGKWKDDTCESRNKPTIVKSYLPLR